jgi:hypothetical protein
VGVETGESQAFEGELAGLAVPAEGVEEEAVVVVEGE